MPLAVVGAPDASPAAVRSTGKLRVYIQGNIHAGTLRVEMTQALARLAFYLLEPRSDDGLTNWNFLDEALRDAKVYPIVRTRN